MARIVIVEVSKAVALTHAAIPPHASLQLVPYVILATKVAAQDSASSLFQELYVVRVLAHAIPKKSVQARMEHVLPIQQLRMDKVVAVVFNAQVGSAHLGICSVRLSWAVTPPTMTPMRAIAKLARLAVPVLILALMSATVCSRTSSMARHVMVVGTVRTVFAPEAR